MRPWLAVTAATAATILGLLALALADLARWPDPRPATARELSRVEAAGRTDYAWCVVYENARFRCRAPGSGSSERCFGVVFDNSGEIRRFVDASIHDHSLGPTTCEERR